MIGDGDGTTSPPKDCRSAAASALPKRAKIPTISREAVGWNGGLGRAVQ
jgi:hypothetical protein